MTEDQIRYLAERVASGTATDEEIQSYNSIYNSFPAAEEWDEHLHGDKDSVKVAMKMLVLDKITAAQPIRSINWIKWIAAASITIIFCAVAFLATRHQSTASQPISAPVQQQRFKNDVDPGHAGAVLTLAHGEKIVLDTAGNGSLANQGGALIIKKNGEINYSQNSGTTAVSYNTMTTPKGRAYKLVLSDGSAVWLDAASSITFPTAFTGNERRVNITGQAYFEIKHNERVPFIVEKGGLAIQVLGTHFNVNAYGDEKSINTTLLEGSVRLTHGNVSGTIRPGQQAQLQNEEIRVVNNVDTAAVMAWKNGFFDFKGIEIDGLLRQLSRWYDVEIVNDTKIKELFYARIPKNTRLSDVLKALELTGKVKFEIDNMRIIVMPEK